jgi:hypothetical protein
MVTHLTWLQQRHLIPCRAAAWFYALCLSQFVLFWCLLLLLLLLQSFDREADIQAIPRASAMTIAVSSAHHAQ